MVIIGEARNMKKNIETYVIKNGAPSDDLSSTSAEQQKDLQPTNDGNTSDTQVTNSLYDIVRMNASPKSTQMIHGIKLRSDRPLKDPNRAYAYVAEGPIELNHKLPESLQGTLYVPIYYNAQDSDHIALLEVLAVLLTPNTNASAQVV
ncbi:hypothetical protein H4R35_006225 [Dimargaris xerosporica]|nr:hypothetical protein H4R35_006225 [Dimargaris xerosporica]